MPLHGLASSTGRWPRTRRGQGRASSRLLALTPCWRWRARGSATSSSKQAAWRPSARCAKELRPGTLRHRGPTGSSASSSCALARLSRRWPAFSIAFAMTPPTPQPGSGSAQPTTVSDAQRPQQSHTAAALSCPVTSGCTPALLSAAYTSTLATFMRLSGISRPLSSRTARRWWRCWASPAAASGKAPPTCGWAPPGLRRRLCIPAPSAPPGLPHCAPGARQRGRPSGTATSCTTAPRPPPPTFHRMAPRSKPGGHGLPGSVRPAVHMPKRCTSIRVGPALPPPGGALPPLCTSRPTSWRQQGTVARAAPTSGHRRLGSSGAPSAWTPPSRGFGRPLARWQKVWRSRRPPYAVLSSSILSTSKHGPPLAACTPKRAAWSWRARPLSRRASPTRNMHRRGKQWPRQPWSPEKAVPGSSWTMPASFTRVEQPRRRLHWWPSAEPLCRAAAALRPLTAACCLPPAGPARSCRSTPSLPPHWPLLLLPVGWALRPWQPLTPLSPF
mmetsp:Transcript_25715/g.71959  ORF Transcript_25715/g.71959 Transcript_25715/m.71959 type:complete len:501 (-) Transcript_25715:25-1527(-)